eukprot:11386569-Prorocentrum_lima.AAC.1
MPSGRPRARQAFCGRGQRLKRWRLARLRLSFLLHLRRTVGSRLRKVFVAGVLPAMDYDAP